MKFYSDLLIESMIEIWLCLLAFWIFLLVFTVNINAENENDQANDAVSQDELPQGFIYIVPNDSRIWQCKRCGLTRKAQKNQYFNNFVAQHRFMFIRF